ncbi:bucentaur or craniofacial development-domain-containing protein [Collybia nuda]|uniref:SWR1-complex protein 5 n=1 Tax=Collybia nuda TaxID=64659 RepID=A0A9P6CBN3_9AGAR|nr:bucentaur or craniofacial development-domain-containing protein [Collybia nuda]
MSPERKLNDSDSEDDVDYVPPAEKEDSSDEEPELKRARTTSPPLPVVTEAEKKQQRDTLWASFQASVEAPSEHVLPESSKPKVKIEKRYRFAGEDVVEVIEVNADSPDAKKWPVWREPGVVDPAPSTSTTPGDIPQLAVKKPDATTVSSDISINLPKKRPGPRKPKVTLAALPASSSAKAKKLTTLDKSAMDWRSHVQATEDPELKDELEANRRSGGYLEKVEFLKRVDERKDDVLEASKGSKRRRP